jgi:hypothetical protein
MLIGIRTVSTEILHNERLALVTFEGSDSEFMPYVYDSAKIKNIDHIVFASESRPLFVDFNDETNQENCEIYAVNKMYANYIGIDDMQDGVIYLPAKNYPDADSYKVTGAFQIPSVPLLVKSYPNDAPLVVYGDGFVSEDTYKEIVRSIDGELLKYVQPIFIIGVDKVENVFDVIRELDNIEQDDDALIVNQANGLENVVKDTKQLMYILIVLLCVITMFNTFIILYFTNSLVSNNRRDLMVLYLNGLSRKNISRYLLKFLQTRVSKVIIIASVLSIIVFYFVSKYLLNQALSVYWIIALIIIDAFVIIINYFTYLFAIRRTVYKQTSNERISKIIRN